MLSLIVAEAENHVIGRGGELPWRLSSDLRRFKELTMGHTLLMGRKTFASIGRLLPGRTTIVITRQQDWHFPGAVVAHSLEDAIRRAADDREAFVVGGGEIYQQTLPRADRIYLTRVHAQIPGDAYFPPLPPEHWQLVHSEFHAAGPRDDHDHTFMIWQSRSSAAREVPSGRL